MKKVRYFFILLLVLTLSLPTAGWAAKDANTAEEVGGRGEGFQPEGKEEAKEGKKGGSQRR